MANNKQKYTLTEEEFTNWLKHLTQEEEPDMSKKELYALSKRVIDLGTASSLLVGYVDIVVNSQLEWLQTNISTLVSMLAQKDVVDVQKFIETAKTNRELQQKLDSMSEEEREAYIRETLEDIKAHKGADAVNG